MQAIVTPVLDALEQEATLAQVVRDFSKEDSAVEKQSKERAQKIERLVRKEDYRAQRARGNFSPQ